MEDPLFVFGWLALGIVIGGGLAWVFLRERTRSAVHQVRAETEPERAALAERARGAEERIGMLEAQLAAQKTELGGEREARARAETRLEQERKAAAEQLALLEQAQVKLSDAFKALSAEALTTNNQSFLQLAKATLEKFQETAKGDLEKKHQAFSELVKPVRDSLEKVDGKIHELEKVRVGAYQGLTEQMKHLMEAHHQLRTETGNLVKALRAPNVRGRWGELQLKRVVEMAGMLEHCDFHEQKTVNGEDGRFRPDLVVRLPGGKQIAVDAKAPLEAYLEAIESQDEATRKSRMASHARQIRAHMSSLSRKAYWEQLKPAPEFVVLFLPGESFFSAALEHDPSLIELGVDEKVILATPTTLIALLRAVAYGWKQERLAQNAQEISDLGRELYKRISDMAGHWSKVGKSLGSAVENYNRAVGSLESRVLTTARKFKELHAAADSLEVEESEVVEQAPRTLQAPELTLPGLDK